MSKLKIINAKKMQKLLLSLGFEKVRQKGSHVLYRYCDGRTTTLPHHDGRVIARPLLRQILRGIEISIDEYNGHLKKL